MSYTAKNGKTYRGSAVNYYVNNNGHTGAELTADGIEQCGTAPAATSAKAGPSATPTTSTGGVVYYRPMLSDLARFGSDPEAQKAPAGAHMLVAENDKPNRWVSTTKCSNEDANNFDTEIDGKKDNYARWLESRPPRPNILPRTR
jgi:hypothetical protein